MKKKLNQLIILVSIIALLAFTGCKKVWDYVKNHPGGIAENCSVERVTYQFEKQSFISYNLETFYDTVSIAYNSSGNPISMKYAISKLPEFYSIRWVGSSIPDRLFKYDDKNRLVVYIEGLWNMYGGEGEVNAPNPYPLESGYVASSWWHKYTYINSTFVTDSIWWGGRGNYLTQNIPDGANGAPYYFDEYTLDNYGRIIKAVRTVYEFGETSYDLPVIFSTEDFTYEASGNLVKPGVTYSNKKNILQTNKVWMFLARDYSVNAPEGQALSYNSNNLPVVFNKVAPPFFPAEEYIYPLQEDTKARAYYKCK